MKDQITIGGIVINNAAGIEWIVGVVESRLKTSSDSQETLRLLSQGIVPKRGSSGPRTEPHHGEVISIVKSYLASFNVKINLRESEGMDKAILALSKRMDVSPEKLESAIDTRARKVWEMKKSLMDEIEL